MAEIANSSSAYDKDPGLCRASDNPRLPRWARLPINRCNLPADILGGLSFQRGPCPLVIDGVAELHADLFAALDPIAAAGDRSRRFEDYMTVHFRLDRPEDMGLTSQAQLDRSRATWLRVLRGWHFDAGGREAAVLKGWVESRFGLLPRHHREALRTPGDAAWLRYEEDRGRGLYGTSALEAQLDLVYAFTQYECARAGLGSHVTLFRGINRGDAYERLSDPGTCEIWLMNNVGSYSTCRERAGEFGDEILQVRVPVAKVFCHSGIFPGRLQGEDEYIVIGGLYEVGLAR
ncbi:MAG: NAD(+)--dinitrogen-reductase ADP-D-ribosyltransferase [Rhodocyclaceae bacterium]|nr:NAD(+)--dinitrogen-reductase ADP-D-ribosyltransferase [Rhodocyclaceae bacterium]